MSAFVFDCGYNGLSVIQSLGRRGVEVFALDVRRSIGTRSRYAKFACCPDPLTNEQSFVQYLIDVGSQFSNKPLLFPTNDQWLLAVSRHKAILDEYFHCCAPDADAAELLLDKLAFGIWAAEQGIPVPRTWPAVDRVAVPLSSYPVVVKPLIRRKSGNDAKGVERANNADSFRLRTCNTPIELNSALDDANRISVDCCIQEKVDGDSSSMYTIGIFAHEGIPKGLFTGHKVRGFPPAFGDCIVGETWSAPATVTNYCKQIIETLRYSGIAEFEFMLDRCTGEYKLIEVNPRTWSWIGITPASGVDLPWLAYKHLVLRENVVYSASGMEDGAVRYTKILQDFQNCLFWYKKEGWFHWHFGLRRWLRDYSGKKTVTAEFAMDDPWVSLAAIWHALKIFHRRLRAGVSKPSDF